MPRLTSSSLIAQIEVERRRLKLTQRSLAERAGITALGYANLVKGNSSPKLDTAISLADAVGLQLVLLPEVVAHCLSASTESSSPAPKSWVEQFVADRTNKPSGPR